MSTAVELPVHERPANLAETPEELLYDGFYYGGKVTVPDLAPLPGVTTLLADRHQEYTTTNERNTTSFREYRKAARLERTYDRIADATKGRFESVPEFQESIKDGTFPLQLAEAFRAIKAIKATGIHYVDPETPRTIRTKDPSDTTNTKTIEVVDRDVYINETIFTVEPGSTELLNTIFNKLLDKDSAKSPVVYADPGGDGRPPTIKITGVNEHDIRALGRAVDAGVHRWLREHFGFTMPNIKRSREVWQEERGQTFPPLFLFYLQRNEAHYQSIQTTTGDDDLDPWNAARTLGTDSSGMFQRWRDCINGLARQVRVTSAHNLEQNPNRAERLSLEAGVELRREELSEEEAAKDNGPANARVTTSTEQTREALLRKIEEAKKKKFQFGIEVLKLVTAGATDLGLTLLSHAPRGIRFSHELSGDAAAYRRHKNNVKLGAVALRGIIWQEIMGPRLRELDDLRAARKQPADTAKSEHTARVPMQREAADS